MIKCDICTAEFESPQQLGGHKSSHGRGAEYRAARAGRMNQCLACYTPTRNPKYCSPTCLIDFYQSQPYIARNGDVLDASKAEVAAYRVTHTRCEICDREVTLCIDHCHENKRFRGVLCTRCNRQLGWFEKHRNEILQYLNK